MYKSIILVLLALPAAAQVTISDSTARYFLEVDDSLQIYKERDSAHIRLNNSLLSTVDFQDTLIINQSKEIKLLGEQNSLTTDHLKFHQDRADKAEKRIKKERLKGTGKGVLVGIAIGIVIMLL